MAEEKNETWMNGMYNYIVNNIIKWKWFPTILLLMISITLFIITEAYIISGNTKPGISIINKLSIAFVAGGAFTVFIKFFQFSHIFKEELRSVIFDEDLHIEKSRKERDNLFINNLDTYSFSFIIHTLKLMVKRIFPNSFSNVLGDDFNDVMAKRLYRELTLIKNNNYIQRNLELIYDIKPYNEDFIIVEQTITATLEKVKDSIIMDRKYENWVPINKAVEKTDSIEVEHFKVGDRDYKYEFKSKSEKTSIGQKLADHIKETKEISIEIPDKQNVKLDCKVNFLLSLDSFLYWKYKFTVYTKDVKVIVRYDESMYLATIMEFAQKEKFDGYDGQLIFKHNKDTIYVPEDSFMLAIHPKK